ALYFVARLAREHVKVVLSGEGADELFAGYNIYREPGSLGPYTELLPEAMRKWIGNLANRLPQGLKGKGYLQRGAKRLEERFFGNACIFSEESKRALLKMTPPVSPYDITHPIYQAGKSQDEVMRMQLIDLKTWLCG